MLLLICGAPKIDLNVNIDPYILGTVEGRGTEGVG
jgi:hypothetical protein